jgi:exonuclease III
MVTPLPTRTPPPVTDRAGAWNLKVGRIPAVVATEVLDLLQTHQLDWLVVMEASGYIATLRDRLDEHGFDVLTGDGDIPSRDTAIIVRRIRDHGQVQVHGLGGVRWERRPGRPGLHAPRKMVSARVRRIRVGSVHLPPGPFGPRYPLRRAAFHAAARRTKRLAARWNELGRSWVLAGDWNKPKREKGSWLVPSPAWIARKTGAKIVGDGIDFVMAKGVKISNYRRIKHGNSDHEPVLFDATY